MAQYIDKSALVEEIERKRNICKKVVLDLRTEENKDYYQGKAEAYKEALDLLDTLEVKEVDLEKEIDNYIYTNMGRQRLALELDWKKCYITFNREKLIDFAKYFFELGPKAQKGE